MDLLSPQLSAHSTRDQNSIERKIGITPNLIGHRLQHPYAEGWTCEIQEQAQAAATGRPNTQPGRIRCSHDFMEDQAGTYRFASAEAEGGWWVHAAQDKRYRNTTTRPKQCSFMYSGRCRPREAAGSRRKGTRQAVAATAGSGPLGNAGSSTTSAIAHLHGGAKECKMGPTLRSSAGKGEGPGLAVNLATGSGGHGCRGRAGLHLQIHLAGFECQRKVATRNRLRRNNRCPSQCPCNRMVCVVWWYLGGHWSSLGRPRRA